MMTPSMQTNYINNHNSAELLRRERNKTQSQKKQVGKTVEGVVVNNFIKDSAELSLSGASSNAMDDICNTLVIPDTFTKHPLFKKDAPAQSAAAKKEKPLYMKALPVAGLSLAFLGGVLGLTTVFKKSASSLNSGKFLKQERLPVLAVNMNIKQEDEFATYMALRNPNKKTILAMIGVFIMSGLTITGKNLIDGIKSVWLKKKEADANKNLQDSLIDIETRAFAGKLDVVREELVNKANYFKSVLDTPDNAKPSPFLTFFGFRGNANKNTAKDGKKNENAQNSPVPLILMAIGTLALGIFAGRKMFKNITEADSEIKKYVQSKGDEINSEIQTLIGKIKTTSGDKSSVPEFSRLKELLQIKRADSLEVENVLGGLDFMSKEDIAKNSAEIMTGVKSIYGDAPETLGGKVGQIQYYCYLDENRGHLYNWIMNPENPFAGYLFLALTTISAAGYSIKEALNAIKDAAVIEENANTERQLQERLVETEIKNFRSKKLSAIEPMMSEFKLKAASGAPKEELKTMADNILLEIKNGPPFVYA